MQPSITEDNSGVWIVVPAYNADDTLASVLHSLISDYPNVVVVDDGSSDRTSQIAIDSGVWNLRHICNCGQGAALQTGIDFALRNGAQCIVTFDADGQHSPEDIRSLVQPVLQKQADVCLGSRFLGRALNLPVSRLLILKLAVLFTRLTTGAAVTDAHNGMRAFSRRAAQSIRIRQNRMAHASEILQLILDNGMSFREIPVTIRYTENSLLRGQSSWNSLRIFAQLAAARMFK